MNLKEIIADYQDFPKKGILFRDFSPILKNPAAMEFIVDEFSKKFHPNDVDVFIGIESRGFIVACALAQKYNKGMVLLRKAGKLPGKTEKISYTIEYGKATMEIQKNALKEGERVVICDDLLATGGTAQAAANPGLYITDIIERDPNYTTLTTGVSQSYTEITPSSSVTWTDKAA